MTQTQVWKDPDLALLPQLWLLADEIPTDATARQKRRAQKRCLYQCAGVFLEGDDRPENWVRDDTTITGPPNSYPPGISPSDGGLHKGA